MSQFFKTALRKEMDKKVLQGNPAQMRKLFLQPKGIEVHKTHMIQPEVPVEKFVNHEMILHRAGKDLSHGTVVFKCNPVLTKPEIKQYFTKIYGFEVQKVNTANYMGKLKKHGIKRYRRKDFKKVYLELKNQKVDQFFQKNVF